MADEKAGFQEITKFYYTAGMHEPGSGLSLATNLDIWEGLSSAHQSIIETAAGDTMYWNLSQFMSQNGAALQRLQAGGVKVLEFLIVFGMPLALQLRRQWINTQAMICMIGPVRATMLRWQLHLGG